MESLGQSKSSLLRVWVVASFQLPSLRSAWRDRNRAGIQAGRSDSLHREYLAKCFSESCLGVLVSWRAPQAPLQLFSAGPPRAGFLRTPQAVCQHLGTGEAAPVF